MKKREDKKKDVGASSGYKGDGEGFGGGGNISGGASAGLAGPSGNADMARPAIAPGLTENT